MHHCIRLLLHELCARKEEVWKSNCKKHAHYKVKRLLQSIVKKTQYVCIQWQMNIDKRQHLVYKNRNTNCSQLFKYIFAEINSTQIIVMKYKFKSGKLLDSNLHNCIQVSTRYSISSLLSKTLMEISWYWLKTNAQGPAFFPQQINVFKLVFLLNILNLDKLILNLILGKQNQSLFASYLI